MNFGACVVFVGGVNNKAPYDVDLAPALLAATGKQFLESRERHPVHATLLAYSIGILCWHTLLAYSIGILYWHTLLAYSIG
jgi:hypothetical protein